MADTTMVPPYPRAFLRLQFNAEFTFHHARELVPYFSELGVSHIYASPILLARPGSPHGYDIVDHARLNPEIGTEEDFDCLIDTLHAHEMGLIMDFVPNHMGVGAADNVWWLDILEWGRSSPYARFFDIDWKPYEQSLYGKVLLPVLGDQYGTVLEHGELRLRFDEANGEFSVWYHEHRFPIAVGHYAELLRGAARRTANAPEGEAGAQLLALAEKAGALGRGTLQPRRQAIQHRAASDIKRALSELCTNDSEIREAISAVAASYNGTPGEPGSFDALHKLLEKQAYRISYWRVASNEINYRRFFDINELAALRMEEPELFDVTHELVFRLLDEGKIQGLRLDHVDGLYDPKSYFERIQKRAANAALPDDAAPTAAAANAAAKARLDQPVYLAVEKILAHHEQLRGDWQVSGTTGYEFMNLVSEMLADPNGEEPLSQLYLEVTGEDQRYEAMVIRAKHRIMHDSLASELNVLANRFNLLAKQSRLTRDFSRIGLRYALADIVANFPVYRTYVSADGVTEQDRRDIDWAVARSKKQSSLPDTSVYDFISDVLTLDLLEKSSHRRVYRKQDIVDLARRVQQFTGPVMAKSLEDTTFYRHARFIARNEVGGDPTRFHTSVYAFHKENKYRLQRFPFSMLCTATHDHKRGEDMRARLNVLSEVPGRFQELVNRLRELSTFFRTAVEEESYPSAQDEYFLYQTIVGSWPPSLSPPAWAGMDEYADRISSYMLKAIREAKSHTSWTAANPAYEEAVLRFVASLLNPNRSKVVLREIHAFVTRIEVPGAINGLSQLALKLTCPGVPDVYQGCDRWDFSLVDPDNRRPVDFQRRIKDAQQLRKEELSSIVGTWRDGRIKQYLLSRILRLRRQLPDLFAVGSYEPLSASGPAGEHVVAFARRSEEHTLLLCVPRCTARLVIGDGSLRLAGFEETRIALPDEIAQVASFRNVLTGEAVQPVSAELDAGSLFARFPVALLTSAE